MNLVFCGTPQFAVPALEALMAAYHQVQLVVTQPDRPSGRGQLVSISAVKHRAVELGLPVIQPEKLKTNPSFQEQLRSLKPDAIIVVAYGRIIPPWMLSLPRFGNLNVHASLLPKYRGAAPIQWAIANGEAVTGVTVMQLDEGLDTGPILLQRKLPIALDDTAMTVAPRLADLGAALMVEGLAQLESGRLKAVPQNHALASLAPVLTKEHGRIDFLQTATEIFNRLRGFQPWPGAYTSFRGRSVKIIKARPDSTAVEVPPATFRVHGDRLLLGCAGPTTLELLALQPEGKREVTALEFINGYRLKSGEKLGR